MGEEGEHEVSNFSPEVEDLEPMTPVATEPKDEEEKKSEQNKSQQVVEPSEIKDEQEESKQD